MRLLLLFSLGYVSLFGFADSLHSLSADFTQSVTDDTNKTITYTGHLDAIRPDKALWRYNTPVRKSVYVIGHNVTIVEPELEQAIVKTFRDEIDLFNILANAKKLDNETYLATHKNQRFLVKIRDDVPMAISYRDAFDNAIRILFSNQRLNSELSATLFSPDIPDEYDTLRE